MGNLIEIADVAKTYTRSGTRALDGVSLSIPEGRIFGLLGPNGAGKSTLLSVLLGLVRKDAGTVRVAGHDMDRELPVIRRLCGLAPQDFGFYPTLTVAENLHFYAAAAGLASAHLRERVAAVLGMTQLDEFRARRADALSGGLKRRLNLALSLLHEPRALFLDEPTVGVDPQSRAFILDVIRQLRDNGTTIVYTSHYMDEVQQLCDQLAIIDHGKVLMEGALSDLLASGHRLQLTMPQAPDAALQAVLRQACPGIECDGNEVSVDTARPLETQAALQAVLSGVAIEPIAITYGHRDLEDVFLQLTHRNLRD